MIETLTKARDLIADRGLSKHVFKDNDGCLCTIGAVIEAAGHDASLGGYDDPLVKSVAKALVNTLFTYGCLTSFELESTSVVYDWNDRNATTQDMAVRLFNDTIELMDK